MERITIKNYSKKMFKMDVNNGTSAMSATLQFQQKSTEK